MAAKRSQQALSRGSFKVTCQGLRKKIGTVLRSTIMSMEEAVQEGEDCEDDATALREVNVP
jgi:hypothetical protein